MDSWLHSPSPFLISFYFFFFATFVGIPASLSDDDHIDPSSCSQMFNCGEIKNIGPPFWEDTRPSDCGSPGLKLHCEGSNVTTIEIMKVTYRVLEVNLETHKLKISREDFLSTGICSPPPELVNTTLDPTLFDFRPGYENITLSYGCPSSSWPHIPLPGHFTCHVSGEVHVDWGAHGPKECNVSVVVPVHVVPDPLLRPDILLSLDKVEQVIREGFEVEWKVDSAASACPTCYSSPSKPEQSPKRNWQLITAIGICTGIAMVAAISLVIIYSFKRGHFSSNSMVWWKRDAKNDHFKTEEIIKSYGLMAPKRYTYSNLKKLTNSFKEKVGQGGYGAVYKGKLPDGRMVAVKMLSASKGNGEEFINEVASISRTSHVNIVTLLGFCYEKSKSALIYEFMPNGSLDKFIYDKGSSITLDSKTMFQIAIGIARGLEYLHRGCNTRILHFDIKPHNILLDEDLHPKISDFGLAKLCKTKESIVSMTGMRGTAGYIAPEVFSRYFGGVSHKSDVYSYGMLVLEMVGARKEFDSGLSQTSETYFPDEIYDKLEQGESFGTLEDIITEKEDTIKKMIIVSLWCTQTIPSDRPSMGKVIEMLEGRLKCLQFPPKPVLHSHVKSPQDSSTTSVT